MEYLFVYGTLLRNINNEMSHYLNANAEFVGKGYFNGEMYDIDNYPGAIISDCCSDRVYGHVYKIRDTKSYFPF